MGIPAHIALAALLVLPWIGRKPFWTDEAWTANAVDRSLGGTFRIFRHRDAATALYYMLLHGWMRLTPGSEGWMRGLSAVFALATVPLTVLLAARLFGRRTAVMAGFVMAVNAFLVAYAQEARTYALAMLLSVASTLLFIRAVEGGSRRSWAAYVAVTVLAVFANMVMVLTVIAQATSLFFSAENRVTSRRIAAVYGSFGAIVIPFAFFNLIFNPEQISWLPPPEGDALLHFFVAMTGSTALLLAVLVILLLWLIRAVRGGSAEPKGAEPKVGWHSRLLMMLLFLPPVLLFAGSQLKPMFSERYLIACIPIFAIAMGRFLSEIRPRVVGAAALLLMLGFWTWRDIRFDRAPYKTDNPRAAAVMVVDASRPGDAVLYLPAWTRVPFQYYLDRVERLSGHGPVDVALAPHSRPAQVGDVIAKEVDASTLARRLASYQRVWVMSAVANTWYLTSEPALQVFQSGFTQKMRRVHSWSFSGNPQYGLFVSLYTRDPGAS